MKKFMRGIMEFFGIINYCVKMMWEASRRYFVIRMILNVISLTVPFAVIALTRMLMDVLARDAVDLSASGMAVRQLVALSGQLLALKVLSRIVETGSTYYEGLHRDTMDTLSGRFCRLSSWFQLFPA